MASTQLSSALEIQVLLLSKAADLSEPSIQSLRQALSIDSIDDSSETGWEETVLGSLFHLLRAKSSGTAAQISQGSG